MDSYQPQAVGLDIFQGGFSLGVQRAGFNLRCNLEEGNFGYETFKANFPNVPVHIGADTWPVEQLYKEDIDLCYSNPPCVVFSAAALSKKDTWRQKAELSCTLLCFDTMERIRPAIYIWECVPRAWTMGRELVDAMTDRALHLGYSVSYIFNDSVILGCAQRRRRFMFVAHIVEIEPFLPVNPVIHTLSEQIEGIVPIFRPGISDGLANAFRLAGETRDLRAAWDSLYTKGVDKGRPKMMDHRVDGDRPCSTITGMLSQVHPTEDRYLAPNEVSRLCGYPDEYKWVYKPGNATDFQQQCCKAVLPGAGEYVATMAMKGLKTGTLTSNRVRVWDPRPWANWQVDRQLDGSTKPEPRVEYIDISRIGHAGRNEFNPAADLEDEEEKIQAPRRSGKSEIVRQAMIKPLAEGKTVTAYQAPKVVQTNLKGITLLSRDQIRPTNGKSPVVIGFGADGRRIRSRNPQFDKDGMAVLRPVGHPMDS